MGSRFALLASYLLLTTSISASCQDNQQSGLASILSSPPPPMRPVHMVPVDCGPKTDCYGISGRVKVKVVVDEGGIPLSVKALEGERRLFTAVENAVRQDRFRVMNPSDAKNRTFEFTLIVPPPK